MNNEFELTINDRDSQSSQRIDRINWDEISDQEENFVSICQNDNNDNNHINIIDPQDIEDSLELTTLAAENSKIKTTMNRSTFIEESKVYQTFFNFYIIT